MWHKAIWKGHPMRLELTRVGLLAELANHYTISAELLYIDSSWSTFAHPCMGVFRSTLLWARPYFSSRVPHVLLVYLGWFSRWVVGVHTAATLWYAASWTCLIQLAEFLCHWHQAFSPYTWSASMCVYIYIYISSSSSWHAASTDFSDPHLPFIASSRSSRLHPVSVQSCCK